jgi:nitrite reductase (NO-forming)
MADTQRQSVVPRPYVHWPKTALRVGFGVIWLIDAILKWLPGFRANYMDTIMGQSDGQPGWLKPWFRFWIDLQRPDTAFFAYLVAVLETLIAVALIAGFEGFGGPYTAGAADVGTALIYALVFAALLTFAYYQGPAPFSVDIWLEKRISWWHWVAEVGNHHDQPALGQTNTVQPSPDATPSRQTKTPHPVA